MADRTEIDALLISALYGELTPADEARLTAHLESHPADRTVLADLTHTRATVRESRILTIQLEPPQSVSALLLQEAARRAPKQAREAAGWFHRFMRSFMVHPAMAAAAMLVLVVGVAGTLYVRNGDQFAGATAPEVARDLQATAREPAAATPPAPAPTIAPEPAPEPETGRFADTQNGAPADRFGAAAGSGAYRVGLDEADSPKPVLSKPVPQDDQAVPVGRAKGEKNLVADGEARVAKEAQRGQAQQLALEQPTKPSVSPPAPKLAKKASSAGRGIELRSPELAPKDLDDDNVQTYAKKDVARRDLGNANADRAGATVAALAQAPGAAPSGGGGATAIPGMMPQQNYAAAPPPAADPVAAAPSTPSNRSSDMAKLKAPAKTVSREAVAQKPASSPPPPPAAAEPPSAQRDSRGLADKLTVSPADTKSAEEKTTEDKALAEWVQKQREQVLAYVKSNNCRAAANAAVAIYNRAPDYYAANIATDREIKPCLPYVNNERERVDRSRAAAKRANAADTPAAAPPTRK